MRQNESFSVAQKKSIMYLHMYLWREEILRRWTFSSFSNFLTVVLLVSSISVCNAMLLQLLLK